MSGIIRTVNAVLEGPKDKKIRSPKDTAAIYESIDGRKYIVCILASFKDKTVTPPIIYQEDSCSVFGTEEFLKAIEIGDGLHVE